MERQFDTLKHKLQRVMDVRVDTFTKYPDKWLRRIPDTPKIDDYGASVRAEMSSIVKKRKAICEPACGEAIYFA